MRNQPLLVSIVIGIIVIFVIVGASLVAKLSNANKDYKKELSLRMQLEEKNQLLQAQVASLTKDKSTLEDDKKVLESMVESLKQDIASLNIEIEKLKKLKEIFEDKLKEELMDEEDLSKTQQ